MTTEAQRIMWLYNEMVKAQNDADLACAPADAVRLQAVANARYREWAAAVDAHGERIARELARAEYAEWEMGVIDGGR